MGAFLEYDDRDLQDTLDRAGQKVANTDGLLRSIGEYLVGDIDERFRTETDPFGRPWKPNSPYTIAKKRAEGKILKVLQRTGHMRSTANYRVTGDTLRVGLSDPKAAKHQFGIGVPKREIIGLGETQQKAIAGIVEDYARILD